MGEKWTVDHISYLLTILLLEKVLVNSDATPSVKSWLNCNHRLPTDSRLWQKKNNQKHPDWINSLYEIYNKEYFIPYYYLETTTNTLHHKIYDIFTYMYLYMYIYVYTHAYFWRTTS